MRSRHGFASSSASGGRPRPGAESGSVALSTSESVWLVSSPNVAQIIGATAPSVGEVKGLAGELRGPGYSPSAGLVGVAVRGGCWFGFAALLAALDPAGRLRGCGDEVGARGVENAGVWVRTAVRS